MALHGGHQGHAGFLDLEESSSSSESDGGHKDKKGYKSVPTEDPSSPASKGGSKGSRPDGSRPGSARAGDPPGLSITDSFILTQLRGWRLLSGAALSSEEWRSILASTKNQLDYDSVREALTVLFDEQIMHRSSTSSPPTYGHGTPHFFNMAEEDTWGDEDWWDDGGKGKGKGRQVYFADEIYTDYMFNKGKGGKKGNGKMNNFFEEFINYMKGYNHKGKGKGHGKLRSKNQGNVNAYYTEDYDFHGLQFDEEQVRRVDIVNGSNTSGTGDSGSWAICLRPSPIRSGPDPLTFMAPKKTTPVELDEERRVEADPRDPRSSPTVWPCFNVHVPNKAQSNKWGTWHHCAVCNLRLDYTPKPGAPANTTACENPTMVQRALKELQAALPQEMNPNGELVKAFMDKVTADERIRYLMMDARSRLEKNMATVAKAKALVKSSNPATHSKNLRTANSAGYAEEAQPVSPTSSWQAVENTELPTTIEFNPMHYLTAEEKDRMMSMIATRVQQSQAQAHMVPESEEELEPDYSRENMSNTVYGQNPLVWEMFCSKDSALAEACMREGIPVERINLAQGFDLYKPETYTTLLHLFRQQRPKKVWISTMCTLFCSWVDLNYHDRREVLDKRRRRERKMFRLLTAFLLQVLFTYKHGECKVESADLVIKTLTLRWLMDKPRPKTIIPDNAKSLVSQKLTEFLADLGIEVMPPPDNESWAHGITERAIGHIKETASLLQQSLPDQDPVLTLAMATGANNNTEYVKGYTSIQWAYGKQTSWSLDELRQQLSLPIDRQQQELLFEAKGDDSHTWQQLSDMIPKREFVDMTGEEPGEDETEEPYLPEIPDERTTRLPPSSTLPPAIRFHGKMPMADTGFPVGFEPPQQDEDDGANVNDYDLDEEQESKRQKTDHENMDDEGDKTKPTSSASGSRRASTSSKTPLLQEEPPPGPLPHEADPGLPEEPESKKQRTDDSDQDDLQLDLQAALQEVQEGYVFEIELDFTSNRQKKQFQRNPEMFLAKKLNSSEVHWKNLNQEERRLMNNAKGGEVSSFLKTQAVRRCLTYEEQQEAQQSDRVLRARWVLVWKPVPEEDRAQAKADRLANPDTTVYDENLTRKAKARIVLLGFQHPDLKDGSLVTMAPVSTQLMRHLSLTVIAQRDWKLESLDLKTAFLQTGEGVMEDRKLWTPGVPELRQALGAHDGELLRILRNVYGNADAPRELWRDVDTKLKSIGAHRLIGDSSFWIWVEENPNPINEADQVNLLLTELTVNKNMAVAVEINQLIKDLKKDPMQIRLWQLPHIDHWQQWVVVTMADQAHANRPQGGSTGGILTCLGGPEQATGDAGKLNTISWRSWRLKRKAISTNDGEMQATLEGEDSNFRVRFMWAQLNGCCALQDTNILEKANKLVSYVKGIVVTDSKGVFDACNKTDAPLLGMSNARSALQGYQLKEQLKESGCRLVWVSGDWNLSDSLTKKSKTCREGLMQFKKNCTWRLRYDEDFIQSEKKAKRMGNSAIQQMRDLQSLVAQEPRKFLDWAAEIGIAQGVAAQQVFGRNAESQMGGFRDPVDTWTFPCVPPLGSLDELYTSLHSRVGMPMAAYFVAKDLTAYLEVTMSSAVFTAAYGYASGCQIPLCWAQSALVATMLPQAKVELEVSQAKQAKVQLEVEAAPLARPADKA
ncbi:Integrase catalytic domain-containing protein [Durusdinium trenchii]|uniref:Integrase catalytic domain-containing protein n=1 Tax=Durusdinium trenchii TaxID=1381693 RepID=A0ABP0MYU3_9DINO